MGSYFQKKGKAFRHGSLKPVCVLVCVHMNLDPKETSGTVTQDPSTLFRDRASHRPGAHSLDKAGQ